MPFSLEQFQRAGDYRSAKNSRLGLTREAHLDAAESVPPFLTALFALHERARPSNRYLGWELDNFPCRTRSGAPRRCFPGSRSAARGSLPAQQHLFRDVEALARECSLGAVIDSWEPDVAFLRRTA